jgi:hypothetical protein
MTMFRHQLILAVRISSRTCFGLAAAGIGSDGRESSVTVLQAIAGARSVQTTVTPVWTMPGPHATIDRLTSEAQCIIDDALMSIVCSSFTLHSAMWRSL